ncbi:DUF4365 domain-containing protein [Corynebacterium dentalis]|uniref:DUF4365 domain-containing protein n=1 Tax=Corynebacterium dentalis TaxID=2014528 RepID=UPI00370DAA9A
MRAPKNEAIGTAGQSFVKGEFEELGWGAVLNPEHDLGTDLWLMARDENRFDLGALVGAQVKAGESYFKSPRNDEESGAVVGWWYAEEKDSHFDYWSEHTIPHILVLRDVKTKTSYWVHITSDIVQSTGKGNKILVPASQRIDESNRDALTAVATSPSRAASLDGSAWGTNWKILHCDRLRYAMIAPRLVAPHPNKGPVLPDATEALAMLIQGRFRDLRSVSSLGVRVETKKIDDPDSYAWQLFDSALKWVETGDLSGFENLGDTTEPCYLAGVAAMQAAAYIEQGEPGRALATIQSVRSKEALGTIDLAWLKSHESRSLVELGRLDEARDLALEVQKLRAVAPNDPTANALVAVTTSIVFDTSGYGVRDIGELIQSIDTATRWWRSQTIASGLEKHFHKQFEKWGRDSSVTWAATDMVWTRLRSATLLAGLSADHSGWRNAMSLLARRELMKANSENAEIILESLTDLLRAGDKDSIVLAVRKYRDDGPTEPLVALVRIIDLESTPRTSLSAALECLHCVGIFAEVESADRHASWLISALEKPDHLRNRLKPLFLIEPALLDSIYGLMRSISAKLKRQIMDHILSLPVVEDQLLARGYGKIVSLVGDGQWTESDRAKLSARKGDNWELQDDIDKVLAVNDPEFKINLQDRIKNGDLKALEIFGNVTELSPDVASEMIEHLVMCIEEQIEKAKNGAYSLGGPEYGQALVVLNAWHRGEARWGAVEILLAEQATHPSHIIGTLHSLGLVAGQLSSTEKARFKPILGAISERPEYERDSVFISLDSSPQSAAKHALLRMFPEEVEDSSIWSLLAGTHRDRVVAASVVGERRWEGDRNLLYSLAKDVHPSVRVAAIAELVRWVAIDAYEPAVTTAVEEQILHGGPLAAARVSGLLLELPKSESRDRLLRSLADHPSALVRSLVADGLTNEKFVPTREIE